jgi:hypothetical protein
VVHRLGSHAKLMDTHLRPAHKFVQEVKVDFDENGSRH